MSQIDILDGRLKQVLLPETEVIKLTTGAKWSEGPLWIEEQDSVIWSDIPNNRVLKWSESTGLVEWKAPANFTNGRYRDLDGNVIHCSHGSRSIQKSDINGNNFETLVDSYQGKRLNSPNDVIVKSDGTIWFTDPPYGILSDDEGFKAESELGDNYVFRYDPAADELSIVTDFIEEPNGLAFSSDESTLYVSDTSSVFSEPGEGNNHIVAFDVIDNSSLANPRIFAVVNPGLPDGFRLDKNDWIYTSSKDSIQVIHSDGTLLGKIYVPEEIGNCTFGGKDRDILYIAGSTSLYMVKLNTSGIQRP